MTVNAPDEAVIEYARLLLRLHELDPQGKNESPELDAICEQLGGPWSRMGGRERQRVKGLSQDLYALADGRHGVQMTAEERQQWAQRAAAALNSKDPDALLRHLREPFPDNAPSGVTEYLQAQCWEHLGYREVALEFMKEAAKTLPHAQLAVTFYLQKLGRVEEAARFANSIITSREANVQASYLAAGTECPMPIG
jgi:tetratricopeptide (TPR) repeat protein